MKQNIFFYLLFFGLLGQPIGLWAQQEPEDIALENDAFQISFYESLKEKGIENYDKAIAALEKCLQLEPNNPVIHFEFGKNYFYQKEYTKAYQSFERATELDPSNRWYWVGLYDVSYATRNYENAIVNIQKLIAFKKEYKEDLVSLYMFTQQYDKALALIDELTETVGKTEVREQFRQQIMSTTRYQGQKATILLQAIDKNPKEESNYVALIYLYSESNEEDKAIEIAKRLEKQIPTSDWAQVSLFKFAIDKEEGAKAAESLHKILASPKIDKKIKHRVFNEFLIFAKNRPELTSDLDRAMTFFNDDSEVKVAKEVGKFYQNKQDWINAIKYYERYTKTNPEDIENVLLLLYSYSQTTQWEMQSKKAENYIELYPLQPEFYYYAGWANNQLTQFKKAKDQLETGLDYIIENQLLEANFYLQLSEAYQGLGDEKKKENYFIKAQKLIKGTNP